MRKNEFMLRIPYGMRDFLPPEAEAKRRMETELAVLFQEWGYEEVATPTVEYLTTLALGSSDLAEQNIFKFFDRDNKTIALRHEMTTPLARVAASRLRDSALPLKLSYIAPVYRYEETQTGRQCEFHQAGVELLGAPDVMADAEVIALAAAGIKQAGVKDFIFNLGQVSFIHGLMRQFGLDDEAQEAVKDAMGRRDLVCLERLSGELNLPAKAARTLLKIPLLSGRQEILTEAYALVDNEMSAAALDNLQRLYTLLQSYDVVDYINFDLGLSRDFDYYTGMVFEAYVPELGFPLCGGGRYDTMLAKFGYDCSATGFAMGIERLMLAAVKQGMEPPERRFVTYVAWRQDRQVEAINQARRLRAAGHSVELAFTAQSADEAREFSRRKGRAALVYVE